MLAQQADVCFAHCCHCWNSSCHFELKKVTDNLVGLEYEDEGLLVGFAFRQSKEPDWRKMFLQQSRFQDQLYPEYSQEGIRIYLELKGLGSIGQKINQYIKPLKLQ